jgi:hypothetical protein
MVELYLHFPLGIRGVVLNCLINEEQGQLYLLPLLLRDYTSRRRELEVKMVTGRIISGFRIYASFDTERQRMRMFYSRDVRHLSC